MEGAGSETKWVEQGLSLKSLRKQVKGVELFPGGNGGPLKKKTQLVHVSGGSPPQTPTGRLDVEEVGVCSHLSHARRRTWKSPPIVASVRKQLKSECHFRGPPYAQDHVGRRPGEN